MIEVCPNLFVGNDSDCINFNGAICHCCKEPHHRRMVGYKGRALSKDHPEYLYAIRGTEIALNMVDVDNPAYHSEEMVNAGLEFIRGSLANGLRVLVACNQGESRAPSVAMLSMRNELPDSFGEAEVEFRKLYPAYNPKNGIREYLRMHWGTKP